jgi:hypothetical protein
MRPTKQLACRAHRPENAPSIGATRGFVSRAARAAEARRPGFRRVLQAFPQGLASCDTASHMRASPYRDAAAAPRRATVRVRYFPCVGIWPLVLALLVGLPLAYYARREAQVPSVVTCTTMRMTDRDKVCVVSTPGMLTQTACRDTPEAIDRALEPSNPFARPVVYATVTTIPTPRSTAPACGAAPEPERALARPPVPDASGAIRPEAGRALIRDCALAPYATGPQRTVSVTVMQRDYLLSAIVLGGLALVALASMLRRRTTITVDGERARVEVRGFVLLRQRFDVPLSAIEGARVADGPCGPLNGKRVELLMQGGARVPLVDAFVPLTAAAHVRAAWRIGQIVAPVGLPSPSPWKRIAVALVAGLAGLAAAVTVHARASHAPHAQTPRLVRAADARDGSTILVASLGERRLAIVADSDARAVRAVDPPRVFGPSGDGEAFHATLATRPGPMVLDARGRLFVALPDEGAIAVLELAEPCDDVRHGISPCRLGGGSLRETARFPTASEPIALAFTRDDETLVVVSGFGHALETFRTDTLARVLAVNLPRSPRALALSTESDRAFVTHDTGGGASVVDLHTGAREDEPLEVKVTLPPTRHEVVLPKGPHDKRTVRRVFFASDTVQAPTLQARLARVGARMYAPGVVVTPGDTSVRVADAYYSDQQPVEAFNLWELSSACPKRVRDRLSPFGVVVTAGRITSPGRPSAGLLGPLSCLLPRAVVADEKNEWLYLACQGPSQIYKIDVAEQPRCFEQGVWGAAYDVADGPSGMALDQEGHALLVWSQFAQTITALPLDPETLLSPPRFVVKRGAEREPPPEWTRVLKTPIDERWAHGRALFYTTNDPRISSGGPACASCHIDGRDDGLTWPTGKGPRQTPMLAGRLHDTAPYGWSGAQPTLHEYLVDTFTRLGGTGLTGPDLDALVAYLDALPTPRVVARDPARLARGRAIFASPGAGCSGCHAGGALTDGERHDVRSRAPADTFDAFDTPSLRAIGGSAPYFHDGRYPTLDALLAGTDGAMGRTKHLGPEERRDLVYYLESL